MKIEGNKITGTVSVKIGDGAMVKILPNPKVSVCPKCLREDCSGELYEECEFDDDDVFNPVPALIALGLITVALLLALGLWLL